MVSKEEEKLQYMKEINEELQELRFVYLDHIRENYITVDDMRFLPL